MSNRSERQPLIMDSRPTSSSVGIPVSTSGTSGRPGAITAGPSSVGGSAYLGGLGGSGPSVGAGGLGAAGSVPFFGQLGDSDEGEDSPLLGADEAADDEEFGDEEEEAEESEEGYGYGYAYEYEAGRGGGGAGDGDGDGDGPGHGHGDGYQKAAQLQGGAVDEQLLLGPARRRRRFRLPGNASRGYARWFWNIIYPSTKLSQFRGVFVPACIGILGPTLFLRMSYVLSQAGFMLTIVMIFTILVIALFTILGLAPVVTNGKLRTGGAYFLISRTLGAELGGAIGLLILLKNIVAAVYYLSTFGEIIQISNAQGTGPVDYNYNYNRGIMVSSVCLMGCFVMALLGPRGFSTIAVGFFFIKVAALLLSAGSFLFVQPHYHHPTSAINASSINYFTGPSQRSFASNWLSVQHHADGVLSHSPLRNFLDMFSIVFAAFSGLGLGVNLTGETRNPGKAIPNGMLQASITGCSFFFIMGAIISGCVWRLYDIPNGAEDVVLRVCVDEAFVLTGMSACCLGTATVHLMSAGNCINSMANDGILPFLQPSRFKWMAEPRNFVQRRWALLLAYLIIQAVVFAGSPATVTPLLSLSFLFFASVMNGAILLLLSIRAPNFRPRFRYFNKWTAVVGLIIPLIAMFGIDEKMTSIFIGVFFALLTLFAIFAPPTSFGEVSQAIIFHQVRKYLLLLGEREISRSASNRFWRPSPLFMSTQSPMFLNNDDIHLMDVANAMKKGGLYVLASVVVSDCNAEAMAERQRHLASWHRIVSENSLKALPVTTIAPTLGEGLRHAVLLSGLGPVRPNIGVVPLATSHAMLSPAAYMTLLRELQMTDMHLALGANHTARMREEMMSYRTFMRRTGSRLPTRVEGSNYMTVDVFAFPLSLDNFSRDPLLWPTYETSVLMCLQLANTLRMNSFWGRNTRLRVIVAVADNRHEAVERQRWTQFLQYIRVEAVLEFLELRPAVEEVLKITLPRVNTAHMPEHIADEEVPQPISSPLITADSPFFTKLTTKSRVTIIHHMLRLTCYASCMLLLPLAPLPEPSTDNDMVYLDLLMQLVDRLPPTFLVHAKTNTIATEL